MSVTQDFEFDESYVIKYIFYVGMVNFSGKRRAIIQLFISIFSLIICGILVYPCGYAYPNLYYEDILVHASMSAFVLNLCFAIETFGYPMKKEHHLAWKLARELFVS